MTPDWMAQAPCRSADPDVFFPESMDDEDAAEARRICSGCPLTQECLAYAQERPEPAGIWGGLTPAQRARRRHGRTPKRVRTRPVRSDTTRTHCRNDHEYTPENTVWIGGLRKCRACRAAASQRQTQRIRDTRKAVAA